MKLLITREELVKILAEGGFSEAKIVLKEWKEQGYLLSQKDRYVSQVKIQDNVGVKGYIILLPQKEDDELLGEQENCGTASKRSSEEEWKPISNSEPFYRDDGIKSEQVIKSSGSVQSNGRYEEEEDIDVELGITPEEQFCESINFEKYEDEEDDIEYDDEV